MSYVELGTSKLPQIDDENCEGIFMRIYDKLTLDNIVRLLDTEGIGSKRIVINKLKNASVSELSELLLSIQIKINEKMIRGETK